MDTQQPQSPVVQPQAPSPPPKPQQSPVFAFSALQIGILVLVFLVGIAASVAFFYRGSSAAETASTPKPAVKRLLSSGTLVVGTDATYPPMEYLDENQNFIGYDVDLANRIGEKLNLKVEFKNITFDDIFTALENREVDIVISSVSITDERRLKYAFSDPYLKAGQVIITRRGNTDIKSTADLRGRKIAVQSGTTNEAQAREFTEPENVLTFDDSILATKAVASGEAEVIFSDLTYAKSIVNTHPNLKIASEPFTSEEYGIVMRQGEDDLVSEINAGLNSLRQQGVLVLLKQKWLE